MTENTGGMRNSPLSIACFCLGVRPTEEWYSKNCFTVSGNNIEKSKKLKLTDNYRFSGTADIKIREGGNSQRKDLMKRPGNDNNCRNMDICVPLGRSLWCFEIYYLRKTNIHLIQYSQSLRKFFPKIKGELRSFCKNRTYFSELRETEIKEPSDGINSKSKELEIMQNIV